MEIRFKKDKLVQVYPRKPKGKWARNPPADERIDDKFL